MLNFGFGEIVLIMVLAIVVVGPERLPEMLLPWQAIRQGDPGEQRSAPPSCWRPTGQTPASGRPSHPKEEAEACAGRA